MISKRIPSILPSPSMDEFLEILNVYSAGGNSLPGDGGPMSRPVRAPHHTISDVGLLGGGAVPGPGEISLAHNGVLFLDELPEFQRAALEAMRQPLETGRVAIARANAHLSYPARVQLIAAMNPCKCGHLADFNRACSSAPVCGERYQRRLSGPLLDRFDLHIDVPPVPPVLSPLPLLLLSLSLLSMMMPLPCRRVPRVCAVWALSGTEA